LDKREHTVPHIFFSSTLVAPFIEEDEVILADHYDLEKIIARGVRALGLIPGAVARNDITFSWFGSVYAGYTVFLARLMGKKSIVVVGGVDAARDREINYGIWLNPWKSVFVRYAYRKADRVLVVDPFLMNEVKRLAGYDGANITTVPTGYDGERWKPGHAKEKMVLTVASCEDKWRMKKKGIDKLFDAARVLPDVRFSVIGIHQALMKEIKHLAPPNVEIISYVPRDELLPHYQKAKVYCQPSYTEGLPNSLCEAMLCGCIPVGTIAGGIPTAIGHTGYVVPYNDQDGLVRVLREALEAPSSHGLHSRERILQEFTVKRREDHLCSIIESLVR